MSTVAVQVNESELAGAHEALWLVEDKLAAVKTERRRLRRDAESQHGRQLSATRERLEALEQQVEAFRFLQRLLDRLVAR